MFSPGEFRDNYSPLTRINGYPIYLVQVFVMIQVVAMIITTFTGPSSPYRYLAFDSVLVHQGWIWQLFTFPLFESPSIWWAIAMLIGWFSGPEVEKYIGRWNMLILYVGMIFAGSLPLAIIGFFPAPAFGIAGSMGLMFGIFIALATLYPNVEFNAMFFRVTLKIAAVILIFVNCMVYIYDFRWPGAVSLVFISAFSHLYLRYLGVRGGLGWFQEWLDNRRLRREARKRNIRVMREKKINRSIDQILDKISRDGIGSLSPEERSALEQARNHLIKRDKSDE